MRPAGAAAALAVVALLAAGCTGSSGGGDTQSGGSPPPSGVSAAPSSGRSSATTGSSSSASGGSSASSGSSGSTSIPAKPVRTSVRQGLHATYTVRVWAEDSSAACSNHATGAGVRAYLQAHACRRVDRYLATTTAGGRTVGISGSTVTFGGATATAGQGAAGFAALLSDPAKGGIDDLFRTGRRLPGGPSTLPATVATNARNDGATVAVVDVWYLSGRTSVDDPGLTELLEAIT